VAISIPFAVIRERCEQMVVVAGGALLQHRLNLVGAPTFPPSLPRELTHQVESVPVESDQFEVNFRAVCHVGVTYLLARSFVPRTEKGRCMARRIKRLRN